MTLAGIWHGATWNFAIWGFLHGVAMIVERLLRIIIPARFQLSNQHIVSRNFRALLIVSIAVLSMVFFILPEFDQSILYLHAILANGDTEEDSERITFILVYTTPIILYHLNYLYRRRRFSRGMPPGIRYFEAAIYSIMLFMLITNSGTADDFVYFQF